MMLKPKCKQYRVSSNTTQKRIHGARYWMVTPRKGMLSLERFQNARFNHEAKHIRTDKIRSFSLPLSFSHYLSTFYYRHLAPFSCRGCINLFVSRRQIHDSRVKNADFASFLDNDRRHSKLHRSLTYSKQSNGGTELTCQERRACLCVSASVSVL